MVAGAVAWLAAHAALAADWPRYRGPANDGHVPPGVPVPATLPAELPPVWSLAIGPGLAAPVVADGCVFYLDTQDGKETVHAAQAADGKALWQTPLDQIITDSQGPGPRCTPVFDDGRLYVQSCRGLFKCLRAADGAPLWSVDFVRDFQAVFIGEMGNASGASRHGYAGSPLVDGDRLYVGVGGTNGASVVCFDKRDGRVVWKSQNDGAGYAGPVVATIGGVKQVLAYTSEALLGLAADDGRLLWRFPIKTSLGRHAAAPVAVDDLVLVSSQDAGLHGLRVARTGEAWTVEPAWISKQATVNFSSPIVIGKQLYALGRSKLVCVEIATGEIRWAQERFSGEPLWKDYTSLIAMGDRFLVLTDKGKLLLVAAEPAAFRRLGQTQAGGLNMGHPAYADGRLYLRDEKNLACFNLMP
jgi:outer membrane protein assembly factor BamB